MTKNNNLVETVTTIGVGVLVLILMVVVVSSFVTGAVGNGIEPETYKSAAGVGEPINLVGVNYTAVQVEQSLGTAVSLSEGSTTTPIQWSPGESWAVATWARIDDPTNQTGVQTVMTADSRATVLYNATSNEWVGVLYDDSTGELTTVRAVANDPGNWTHITLERDGSSLYLTQNGTVESTVTVGQSAPAGDLTGGTYSGDLEETRLFTGSLNTTQRDTLVNDPTAPAGSHVRVMYDDYRKIGDTVSSFVTFGDGAAGQTTVSNGVLISGFEGANVSTADWEIDGRQLVRTNGSILTNSPMYVTYTSTVLGAFYGAIVGVLDAARTGFVIFSLALLLFPALYIYANYGDRMTR